MKKVFIVVLIILALLFGGSSTIPFWNEKIEPGQIWVYEQGNPFEKIVFEYEIVAVKDGYVQYKRVGSDILLVSRFRWFWTGLYLKQNKL